MANWLKLGIDIITTVATTVNPMAGLIVSGISAVVEKRNDGISNDSVMKVIGEMGLSTWNNLTPQKIEAMNVILNMSDESEAQITELFNRDLDSKDLRNLLNHYNGQ